MEIWVVSVPNEAPGAQRESFAKLKDAVTGKPGSCEIFPFDVPELLVGTLDSLMAASDNLAKADTSVEQVVRKIERVFHDVNKSFASLTVNGTPTEAYLRNFRWASAKYPHHRPVPDLSKLVCLNILKIEEELKEISQMFQEKKARHVASKRKRGNANMMAGDLGKFVAGKLRGEDFVDTEYLTTLCVVVPAGGEGRWVSTYECLGRDAPGVTLQGGERAVMGSPAVGSPAVGSPAVGSPVVPRSARKVCEDGEGFSLYLVTVLRKFAAQFKAACRESRYTVREFCLDDIAGDATREDEAVGLEVDFNAAESSLRRWCMAHYGEAFIAWAHVKVRRLLPQLSRTQSGFNYSVRESNVPRQL